MFPNSFLKNYWRLEHRDIVFVAMPFDDVHDARYENVFCPAITGLKSEGILLKPYRVDISQTGDSILTDIVDGIAHCRLFLADISTVGNDAKTSDPYRNGNVMYEVGLALACRSSAETLLVKDDQESSLFDVSVIPTQTINFTEVPAATEALQSALRDRLREQKLIADARVTIAKSQISSEEFIELHYAAKIGLYRAWGRHHRPYAGHHELAIARLLDKQIVEMVGLFPNGNPAYKLTPLGRVVAQEIVQPIDRVEDVAPRESKSESPFFPG